MDKLISGFEKEVFENPEKGREWMDNYLKEVFLRFGLDYEIKFISLCRCQLLGKATRGDTAWREIRALP